MCIILILEIKISNAHMTILIKIDQIFKRNIFKKRKISWFSPMQRRYRQRQDHCQRQAKLITVAIITKPYHRKLLR